MILYGKQEQHQPLNRQRDRYARRGVDLSLSTLTDQVGACTVARRPLHDLIASQVLPAGRQHDDDILVPVLAYRLRMKRMRQSCHVAPRMGLAAAFSPLWLSEICSARPHSSTGPLPELLQYWVRCIRSVRP